MALKVNKLISYNGWKKTTLNDFSTQLTDTGFGSDWPRTACTDKNINLLDKLALSQEKHHSLTIL